MAAVLLVSALVIGCLLAVQASANPQLAKAVGTPYGGATVQLWVAVGLLALLALAVGAFGAFGLLGTVPAWYLLGGLASPLYITSGILLFPRMGALAAGGLFGTGQVVSSLAVDLFGLFGIERRPVTVGIVAGAAAVLIGIILIIRAQRSRAAAPAVVPAGVGAAATGAGGAPPVSPPAPATPAPASPAPASPAPAAPAAPAARTGAGWVVLGLVAGAVLPIQGAINARLRGALAAPIAVALVSFLVAALAISIVLLLLRVTKQTAALKLSGVTTMPWWGWLGGACAAVYVTGTFLLIPAIGAAVTIALTVTGQQLAAAAVDATGSFRLPKRPITAVRGGGLALLVVGSGLVQLL